MIGLLLYILLFFWFIETSTVVAYCGTIVCYFLHPILLCQVADELVAEFSDPNNNIDAADPDNPNAVKKHDLSWAPNICLIEYVLNPHCLLKCSNNMMRKI